MPANSNVNWPFCDTSINITIGNLQFHHGHSELGGLKNNSLRWMRHYELIHYSRQLPNDFILLVAPSPSFGRHQNDQITILRRASPRCIKLAGKTRPDGPHLITAFVVATSPSRACLAALYSHGSFEKQHRTSLAASLDAIDQHVIEPNSPKFRPRSDLCTHTVTDHVRASEDFCLAVREGV